MDKPREAYKQMRARAAEVAASRATRVRQVAALNRLRRELKDLVRSRDPRDPVTLEARQALELRVKEAEQALQTLATEISERSTALADVLARFGQQSNPEKMATQLDGSTPLLLLPLRLETRFVGDELWLRVYPDQWAVDTFDPTPTAQEIVNVRSFWASWFRAGGDEGMRRSAWRALVASHGSGRAEWLIGLHRPITPGDEPQRTAPDEVILVVATDTVLTAAERTALATYWEALWRAGGDPDGAALSALESVVGAARAQVLLAAVPATLSERPAGVVPASALVTVAFATFPVVAEADTGVASWSVPGRAHLLPDRLVVLGFRADVEVLHFSGRPIPPELAVGPDPAAGPDEQFKVVNGDLLVPDALRWMTDFEAAIEVGMGMKIPLTPELRSGFDQLAVLGLRCAATPQEDAAALEMLLTHHRRSRAGLSIVRQGTPTNNTEGLPSGLDRLDDPDASYEHVFGGGASLVDEPRWAHKQDGQWLAECLGIDPAALDGLGGAGLTDQAEAHAMNTALWPATLGYFVETMMHPVLADGATEQVRRFFIDHVSGRGRVPALRIGRQPYGILPVTALAKLRFGAKPTGAPATPDTGLLNTLRQMLMRVAKDWAGLAATAPHIHAGTEPHQTLLDVVAMHPASVEFHQRYADSIDDLFNRFGFENLSGYFYTVWEALGSMLAGRQLLADLGYAGSDTPDILGKLFHGTQQRLRGPLIDDRPLSETATVRAYCDDGRNYLQWLAEAAGKSLETLRKEEGFSGGQEPSALLYILLRHSLLLSWWDAAARLRLDAQISTPASFRAAHAEPSFVHIAGDGPSESRWNALYEPAAKITGNEAAPLHEFIPKLFDQPGARHLSETRAAVGRLAGLPTARLERLLAEHLDCCSHRADAWLGALVTRRLLDLRQVYASDTASSRKPARRGLHTGAFGWLEQVRPEARSLQHVELSEQLAAVFARAGDAPLWHDSSNGGHVHAPSLDHAATAAILRSGFLANATPAHPDTMAVNLSSGRMRLALDVLQGLRNGQALGALLGYRIERGLHDRHGLAEVDAFIHALRLQFPSPGDRDGRLVTDGLELVRHVQNSGLRHYPFGRLGMPAASAAQQLAIDLEVERLVDINDAVADLVLAEGVHQAVLGNFERVAATLDAVGRGGFPTEPAVLETPRTGATLTQRIGIHLRPGLDHLASPVAGVAVTPRAMAEPGVNELLAAMLPLPGTVTARVSWRTRAGAVQESSVTQADIGLQPIDLVQLLRLQDQTALGEIEQRLVLHVERANALPPDTVVRVEFTAPAAGSITFFEVAPLAATLRSIVTRSRPLRPTDVVPAGEAAGGDGQLQASRSRPAAVLAALDALSADFAAQAAIIAPLLAAPELNRATLAATVDTRTDATIDLLARAGRFALPNSGWGDIDQRRTEVFGLVLRLTDEVVARWLPRLAAADTLLARDDALPTTASDEERVRILLLAEQQLTSMPSKPVPTDAPAFRTAIDTLRSTFAIRLAALQNVAATTTLHGAIAAVDALLPLAPFDTLPFDSTAIDDAVAALFGHLAHRLAAAVDEADRRRAAAAAALATHDAAATGSARVEALTVAVHALLGEDALFVPEFRLEPAQQAEWTAALAWSRTGNLTAHLASAREFPVDDWLHGVARVREKVHDFEQARLLAAAFGRGEPELWPLQVPHNAEPWFGLEWPAGTALHGERLLYTAHYPAAFDPTAAQAGLLLDEWVEMVPGDNVTTGVVFHHDSPDSEPPQAMLLVVPPDPNEGWAWNDIVAALRDTFELARLRAVEPDRVADTRYAAFLPATVSSATIRGLGISANLARNNKLFEHLKVDRA